MKMNRTKFSNVTSLCVILAFVLFLFLLLSATLLRDSESYSYFENRNLAAFPTPEAEAVLDGSYFSDIDTYTKDHVAGRNSLLKANTYIDLYLLRRPVVNQVVVADDLLLPWKDYEVVDEEVIETLADIEAEKLKGHSDLVESYGGHFYYVAIPCQYVCLEDSYPSYLNNREEYTDVSSAALFSRLDTLSVDYIDMMTYYVEAGKPESFTSTVDNHFSIFGAYDTYRVLLDRLAVDTDYELPVLTEDKYTVTELPNTYLGSRMRKLFGMWDSTEKLSIITPTESIAFDRTNYGGNLGASIVYSLPSSDFEDVLYAMYMGGDISDTVIDTHREELPSILIYGDSFTNAVECIAWYSFDEMYTYDFRYYTEMTLDEIIEEKKPDVVVCIRDYEALLSATGNGQ